MSVLHFKIQREQRPSKRKGGMNTATSPYFRLQFWIVIINFIKVTDFAEEKEILSTGNELEDAIVAIRNKQNQKAAEKLAREKELAKVIFLNLIMWKRSVLIPIWNGWKETLDTSLF